MTIKQLLQKIADNMEKSSMQDRLWNIKDLAFYFDCHQSSAYAIKDRPDFPRPIVLSKQPRWKPDEVKSWADRQRG